ncbi:MAG: hypothetical protein COX70_07050 [Flavobacteriales bacterium CG_4_10_14_0_2_um_filter_32_8]|nr:MAG: hypothetical protein COX70_07050 [Flavobacteriales bacterium CG_4_10_14_0_2_um_filter_32_8]PJB15280.1 MAG: hypothetical protein CO118_04230 [Flavobacteriales bacterium CG_4_9_14_3_um_filter_32_8]
MKVGLTISLLLIYVVGFTQTNKFLENLDTNLLQRNTFISSYNNSGSFFSSGLADQELIPFEINEELLNATVFFMINEKRKHSHRSELEFSSELELTAYNFIKQFNVFKFKRLKNNNAKVSKILPAAFKKLNIKNGLSKGLVAMPQLVDYQFGKRYYYDKSDEATDLQLFYGKKISPKDIENGELKIAIPTYTYFSFAEKLVNDFFSGFTGRYAKSKSYTLAACYLEIDKNSLYKNKIPRAKAIFILSGKRTGQLIVMK